MAPLSIKVSGHSTITRRPERAILSATIRAESSEKEVVSRAVTSTSNELHACFTQLSRKNESGDSDPNAPIAVFSSTSISTGFSNNYDNKGKLVGPLHYATVSYSAHFRDFSKLSEVVAMLAASPEAEINSIEWSLTDETKKSLASESRKLAMQDAIQKANDYAEVIGRKVVPAEICENGNSDYQMSHAFNMSGPPELSLRQVMVTEGAHRDGAVSKDVIDMTPQDIKLTGSVNVKFVAVDDGI